VGSADESSAMRAACTGFAAASPKMAWVGRRHCSRSAMPAKSSSSTLATQIRKTAAIARACWRIRTEAARPRPT
jgi:hypothetical protein